MFIGKLYLIVGEIFNYTFEVSVNLRTFYGEDVILYSGCRINAFFCTAKGSERNASRPLSGQTNIKETIMRQPLFSEVLCCFKDTEIEANHASLPSRRSLIKTALTLGFAIGMFHSEDTATSQSSAQAYQPQCIIGNEYEKGIPASEFGMTELALVRLEDRAWNTVLRYDHDFAPTTIKLLAQKLRRTADSLLDGRNVSNTARGYLVTYVVAAWVSSHMHYYTAAHEDSNTGIDVNGHIVEIEKNFSWINIGELLRCSTLNGACRHSAVLARDLITAACPDLGIEAHYVSGWLRTSGPLSSGPNHGWNMVILENGRHLVFDATGSTDMPLTKWRERHIACTLSPIPDKIVPRSPEQLEVFLATRLGTTLDLAYGITDQNGLARRKGSYPGQNKQDIITHMTLDQWSAMDSQQINGLRKWLYQQVRR